MISISLEHYIKTGIYLSAITYLDLEFKLLFSIKRFLYRQKLLDFRQLLKLR